MKFSKLKRMLIGTILGHRVMRSRQLWNLWQTARSNPEQGGFLSQDLCFTLLLPRLCDPSRVFIDVGGHIGSVIADVQRCDPSIHVIAIEADPDKAALLAQKFRNIKVHNCAIGEKEGSVTFFIDKDRPGYSSLAQGTRSDEAVQKISVKMHRLDDLISTVVEVDVIKIDVEGAELAVLRGASQLVSRCRPVIMFESGPYASKAMGFSFEDLFDWFAQREYEILVPDRVAHDGPSLHREGFVESHVYPFRTLNYFAIPLERRIEIRDRARKALNISTDV